MVGTRIGAFVISGLFFPRPLPVSLTSGLAFSGEALGYFLFSRCLEFDRERLASLISRMDFLGGGVSGMANSKPTLGFSGATGCYLGITGSGAAGSGTQGTIVGAITVG